ncbi:MAG: carbamoyltransferase HypF, partial [Candidatus Competibacteraceae bacterium]|nr:carbamoyltransferase HypF [Candidatus Competibacteraceae bacterium]
SGEPVITDHEQAEARLYKIAGAFLHHNRPIERPADDPVYRLIAGSPRPIRLGRGNAPLELQLPQPLPEPVLALGGHLKVTVALAWEQRVVISPHIGELGSPRSLAVFEQVGQDLQRLYGVTATQLICDVHPQYTGTRWAKRQNLPLASVFHHHAHASGLAGEHPAIEPWLMFTWDGVGYGPDGTLWGGETLWGQPGAWRQLGGLRQFRLPGGDKAGREPWRSAAALCWEAEFDWETSAATDWGLARHAWERGLNSPLSSAAGRLCDAAAALIMGIHQCSFEGQGPMQLEALADGCRDCDDSIEMPLSLDEAKVLRWDWSVLLPLLTDQHASPAYRAAVFHNSLADVAIQQALSIREQYPFTAVGLTGGVFQNRWLAERIVTRLSERGIPVYLPAKTPCNDGGLSFGQIIEWAASR